MLADAFGNAVGNAIVAGRVKADVDERNATLKDAYLGMQRNAVERQFDSQALLLGQNASRAITNQAADDINVDMQKEMANFVDKQQNQVTNDTQARFAQDAVANDNANQALMQNSQGYQQETALLESERIALSQQHKDIRAANKVAAQNRYNNMQTFKLKGGGIDFANDVDWLEVGAFQEAAWADGRRRVEAWNEAGSYIKNSAQGAGEYVKEVFEGSFDYLMNLDRPLNQIYQAGNDSVNQFFDYLNDRQDGVRTITESIGVGSDISWLGANADGHFAVSNEGVLAVNLLSLGWELHSTPSFGVDVGFTKQTWNSKKENATPEVVLNGWASKKEYSVELPAKFDAGLVYSKAWSTEPYTSDVNAVGEGFQFRRSLSYSPGYIPIGVSTNLDYGFEKTYLELDAGWVGKMMFWGRD